MAFFIGFHFDVIPGFPAFSNVTKAPVTVFPSVSAMVPSTNACCEKAGAADTTSATTVSLKDLKENDIQRSYFNRKLYPEGASKCIRHAADSSFSTAYPCSQLSQPLGELPD